MSAFESLELYNTIDRQNICFGMGYMPNKIIDQRL